MKERGIHDRIICTTCGRRKWWTDHTCPPEWDVRADGRADEEWETVYAEHADDAACVWLEQIHRGNGVYNDEEYAVIVRKPGMIGTGQRYIVQMRTEPDYVAIRDRSYDEE